MTRILKLFHLIKANKQHKTKYFRFNKLEKDNKKIKSSQIININYGSRLINTF
jgi:hypothetical protein